MVFFAKKRTFHFSSRDKLGLSFHLPKDQFFDQKYISVRKFMVKMYPFTLPPWLKLYIDWQTSFVKMTTLENSGFHISIFQFLICFVQAFASRLTILTSEENLKNLVVQRPCSFFIYPRLFFGVRRFFIKVRDFWALKCWSTLHVLANSVHEFCQRVTELVIRHLRVPVFRTEKDMQKWLPFTSGLLSDIG